MDLTSTSSLRRQCECRGLWPCRRRRRRLGAESRWFASGTSVCRTLVASFSSSCRFCKATRIFSTCFSTPPLLSYRRPRNLRDLLVHTTCKNPDHRVHSAAGSYKCEHARCMTCVRIVNLTRIELKSESRPIHGHFTCETRALVNLITCSSCNAVYVSETGQKLRERLNGHRADIRNGNDTPVGVHLCQPGHKLRVSGLELTSKNAT